ncbi:hypothetical protein RQP46_001772 [Phenoliferia psychrophenolica]
MSAAAFVDDFFHRILYQPDDAVAAEALSLDLSEDARININGTDLTAAAFSSMIKNQFRGTQIGALISSKDLNTSPLDPYGKTGAVAQTSQYTTTGKEDGKVVPQTATTLVKVEERNGKRIVTSLFEVTSVDV